ncbi:hypothetical protein FLGSB24_36710 [Flavobacterium sp. GSB-24]|nr:hypothetical protein FLGSB24_36710 [Flavobacterium sp. GSB-24]
MGFSKKIITMKLSHLLSFLPFLIFSGVRAQKQEIKSAFRELREGYPQRALTLISDLDYKILNATDEEKSDYYYIKGVSNYSLAENKGDNKNLGLAVQAFNELLITENSTRLFKYSESVKSAIYDIKRKLANRGAVLFMEKKYEASGNNFLDLYQLDKDQLCYLYYGAYINIIAKNYSNALNYFTELKKKNYTGKVNFYYAVNASTRKDDEFSSKSERDKAVAAGTHRKLPIDMDDPKKENILKNIIILNFLLGNAENAKKAILEYRIHEVGNRVFDIAEFKLYLETRDYQGFEKILLERIQKDPNDADLQFYLGIINEKLNKKKEAKKYFKRVLEINPIYQFENDDRLTSSMEAEKIFNDLDEEIILKSIADANP